MFRVESDFTKDERTIFAQITETDSLISDNLGSLYIYALYFVLTVLTTVGYGHATYGHSDELIYVIVLEAIAAVTQGYAIVLFQSFFKISQYSFKSLLF